MGGRKGILSDISVTFIVLAYAKSNGVYLVIMKKGKKSFPTGSQAP